MSKLLVNDGAMTRIQVSTEPSAITPAKVQNSITLLNCMLSAYLLSREANEKFREKDSIPNSQE